MQRTIRCGLVASVCALIAAVGAGGAHGQVGDTVLILDGDAARVLEELEPRTPLNPPGPGDFLPAAASIEITEVGSYVLTGNIKGVAGKHGIEVKISNVTIDLNGFAIVGRPGALSGIHAPSGVVNIKIYNGAVRGWPEHGVSGNRMTSSEVSDLRVGNCGLNGIELGQGIVSGCTARLNGQDGINVPKGKSVVQDCAVELNGAIGVYTGHYSTIRDVSATGNGTDGIECGKGCNVIDCATSENDGDGIYTSGRGTVRGCAVRDNGDIGIFCDADAVIESCAVGNNAIGGISANFGALVIGCEVRSSGATDEFGIRVFVDSTVIGNTCDGNDINILIMGSDNRVDSNDVTDGDIGIKVTTSGNIIVRNSSACPSDYEIVGSNQVGAISTNPATAGPWDNFDY